MDIWNSSRTWTVFTNSENSKISKLHLSNESINTSEMYHITFYVINLHDLFKASGPYSSLLTIDDVSPRHDGNYTCHASNEAASTSHTAVLHVDGRQGSRDIFILKSNKILSNKGTSKSFKTAHMYSMCSFKYFL